MKDEFVLKKLLLLPNTLMLFRKVTFPLAKAFTKNPWPEAIFPVGTVLFTPKFVADVPTPPTKL